MLIRSKLELMGRRFGLGLLVLVALGASLARAWPKWFPTSGRGQAHGGARGESQKGPVEADSGAHRGPGIESGLDADYGNSAPHEK